MRQLAVFLKYPTPGQVKTRLAVHVGDDAAAAIYRASTELTLERLHRFHREATLCVDPPDALARVRAWLGSEWSVRPQQGTTLGARLQEAMMSAFRDGVQRLVMIGTDSPWLTTSDIDHAFDILAGADVVLGPTEDGGYYLIGLSRCAPAIFEGIAWSSSSVYAQTLAQAAALGLHVETLRHGYDLDQLHDVQRFLSDEHRHAPVPAAITKMKRHVTQRRLACPS